MKNKHKNKVHTHMYSYSKELKIPCEITMISKNGQEYMVSYQDPELGGISDSWVPKWRVTAIR